MVSGLRKRGSWEQVTTVLEEMLNLGMEPSAMTYGATLSALERGGRWEGAVAILQQTLAARAAGNLELERGWKAMTFLDRMLFAEARGASVRRRKVPETEVARL